MHSAGFTSRSRTSKILEALVASEAITRVDGAKYQIANKTWVRMRTGGASTSGLKSVITITREMKRSLQENNLYTNELMLVCRLPFKLLTQVLRK